MAVEPDVAFVAGLLGDRSRAAMCLALVDGRSLPAGELARCAGVSAQTASNHLAKLVGGGLLEVDQQGRWRYYRLAGAEVAYAVEALAVVAPQAQGTGEWDDEAKRALRDARTCYHHLAGRLGVALREALQGAGWLAEENGGYQITAAGDAHFGTLGIDVSALRRERRPLARRCVDWSERRPHIAGALGAALADLAFANDWVRRKQGTRALLVTPFGRSELKRVLRVSL